MYENLFPQIDRMIEEINLHINDKFTTAAEERLLRIPQIPADDNALLRKMAHIIAFSGTRSNRVEEITNQDGAYDRVFRGFRVNEVAQMSQNEIKQRYWDSIAPIRFPAKIGRIITIAQIMKRLARPTEPFLRLFTNIPKTVDTEEDIVLFWKGFDHLQNKFQQNHIPHFRGTTTILHFLLDMGYFCVKPDLIIMNVSEKLFPDILKQCRNQDEKLKTAVRIIQYYSLARREYPALFPLTPAVLDLYFLVAGGHSSHRDTVNETYFR